ncbi:MAG: domain S-box-containing protein [Labilithrix sp.]|nr:domain S-box-containing protein [Labilithrix sp.]
MELRWALGGGSLGNDKHPDGEAGRGTRDEAALAFASSPPRASVDFDAPFRAVIEASPIPFAINDEHQRITYLNPEFVRTFGYTREHIPTLGDWWPRAYPDPQYRGWVAEEWAKRFAESQRTGAPFEPMDIVIQALDGSVRNVVVYAAPLGEELSGTHLVVLYDVTKQRRLAEEQRALREELIEAQRLESVGRLAGGVAHDFNNMLGVILGRTEVALKGLAPSDPSHAHLVEIRDAAQRSAELTRQLLVYARRQTATPYVVEPNEAIEASVRMLKLLVGEGVTLEWVPGSDIFPVRIDPSQLDQILTNLCANARDAISGAGTVTIRTENVTVRDASLVTRGRLAAGDYAMIEVSDDGAGIEQSVLPHVFEPFFTTKPTGRGSGLGLATVYGIARQIDGGVLVESTVGRGSVFKVLLPRYVDGAEPARARVQAASAVRGQPGSQTVLLVEDEPAMLSVVADMLKSLGYAVLTAGSAAEAIEIAERREVDLLVTDLVMPSTNGRDLAERLLAMRPGLPRVFISGYPDTTISAHYPVETGAHFLAKPFSLDELATTVRGALDAK